MGCGRLLRSGYLHRNSYTGQCPLWLGWCGTRREQRRGRSSTEVWADEGWLEERLLVLVVRDTLGSLRQARANIKAQIGRRKRLTGGNFSKNPPPSAPGVAIRIQNYCYSADEE
jgi:hypothetical protein